MPREITIREAETIRSELKLDDYTFSVRLGLSPTSYYQAKRRKKIGRFLASRIEICYPRQLAAAQEK